MIRVSDAGDRRGTVLLRKKIRIPKAGRILSLRAQPPRRSRPKTPSRYRRRQAPRRFPGSRRAFGGFGDTEEVIEEIVETVSPPARTGLKMAISVGALGLLGLGLFYGLTAKSYTGQRVYRWGT
jgi:hypothetical protein